jgi:hypothetical protein
MYITIYDEAEEQQHSRKKIKLFIAAITKPKIRVDQ